MNSVAKTLFSPVKWISHKITDGNEKAPTVKNFLSSLTSGCLTIMSTPKELAKHIEWMHAVQFLKGIASPLQHAVDRINSVVTSALPTVKSVYNTLDVTKDYLTWLEFYGYVKDLYATDLPQKTFAKKANLGFKLGFTMLETFILLPKKLNWYDLVSYSPISFITSTSLKICSYTLVMCSSVFAIWAAAQDIGKAQDSTAKNLGRLQKLDNIKKANGEGNVTALVKTYLDGRIRSEDKIKATTDKLKVLYGALLQVEISIRSISKEIEKLSVDKTEKVKELSEQLEKLKSGVPKIQSKISRMVYFHKVATGTDLSTETLKEFEKQYILKVVNHKIDQISGQARTTLNNITNEKSADDMKKILHAAQTLASEHEKKIINDLDSLISTNMQYFKDITDTGIRTYSEEAIKHIVDYKIRKFSSEIELNDAKVIRAVRARNYEITKISIVACVTLGLLITHSLAPALLVSYAAVIDTATWYSGLSICITGMQRTIFETFYWKEPDLHARPTTNLRQFAAPAA